MRFIKLTGSVDGAALWINMDNIEAITVHSEGGTRLMPIGPSRCDYYVVETPAEVFEKLGLDADSPSLDEEGMEDMRGSGNPEYDPRYRD